MQMDRLGLMIANALRSRRWAGFVSLLLLSSVAHAQAGGGSDTMQIRVSSKPLSEVWIKPQQRVNAEVKALNHAQISAQANGEVLQLTAEVGDAVEKGEVLVKLDCRKSELSEAVLNDVLGLARKEYQRAQSLQKTKTIAEQELSRLQSVLEQARIRIQQAELAVENCQVKAPFSGVVTERQVQLGMVASVGAPMYKILQSDAVEVSLALDAVALRSLRRSSDIRFESAGQLYRVKLRAVLPLIDPVSNKQQVRLTFKEQRPVPGASGELLWSASGQYLPADLLLSRQGSMGYFILDKDVAHFIRLPDARLGHPAQLSSNATLNGDTQVVIQGRFALSDGDQVVLQDDIGE